MAGSSGFGKCLLALNEPKKEARHFRELQKLWQNNGGDILPNRIIKESICTSEDIAGLSMGAEILFYHLMVKVDDFGVYFGNEQIIKNTCLFEETTPFTFRQVSSWTCPAYSLFSLKYWMEAKPHSKAISLMLFCVFMSISSADKSLTKLIYSNKVAPVAALNSRHRRKRSLFIMYPKPSSKAWYDSFHLYIAPRVQALWSCRHHTRYLHQKAGSFVA